MARREKKPVHKVVMTEGKELSTYYLLMILLSLILIPFLINNYTSNYIIAQNIGQ